MLVSSAAESADAPAHRPFQCPDCGSRYTRQEHLDRHISAKHRAAKDHVCATCGKGFARRDILRRHELGHVQKNERDSGNESPRPSTSAPAQPRTTPALQAAKKRALVSQSEDDASSSAKAARTARACNRCSRAKLRCDGHEPCERCAKGNHECKYDRPIHTSTSNNSYEESQDVYGSPDTRSDGGSVSSSGSMLDLDEERRTIGHPYPPIHYTGRSLTPQPWSGYHSRGNSPRAMSPYGGSYGLGGVSLHGRPSPLSQLALHPGGYNSHSALSSPLHAPPFYSHPDSSVRADLRDSPEFRTSPLPGPYAQQSNQYAVGQQQQLPFPSQIALGNYGASAYQEPVTASSTWPLGSQFGLEQQPATMVDSTEPGQLSNGDFLDLIASLAQNDDIDWSILGAEQDINNAAYPPVSAGLDLTPVDHLHARLHSYQDAQQPAPALNVDPPSHESSKPASAHQTPYVGLDSLAIQGSAAASLLQLSGTPRESPEPDAVLSRVGTPSKFIKQEEGVRTSHLNHLASDPWLMSYKPTVANEEFVPASGVGSGYTSRAMSPAPGGGARALLSGAVSEAEARTATARIPAVTELTRGKMMEAARQVDGQVGAGGVAVRSIPRLQLLNLFVQFYFTHFHVILPLLHLPTFDPNAVPAYLVLAVASVGARHATGRVRGAQMHAQAMSEASRRMVEISGHLDNTLLRTVPWQQAMLLILYSGLFTGNKRDLEKSEAFKSMAVTFCKRQGWLREPAVDEDEEQHRSVEERWLRWRDREELKRLGFGAVGLDTTATLCWDIHGSSLYLEAAHATLPCHDALWEAPSAEAWAALFPGSALPVRGLTTMAALHALSNRDQHGSDALRSVKSDGFAMTLLLGIVHAIGWLRAHEEEVTAAFLPQAKGWGEGGGVAREALESAWEFYQERVVLPAEVQRGLVGGAGGLGQAGGTGVGLNLGLQLVALTVRLPLRLLQPLARPAGAVSVATSQAHRDALKGWAAAKGGRVARRTAHHAGQLLGLAGHGAGAAASAGQPLEPFALFYGALALVAYVRFAAPSGQAVVKEEDVKMAPPTGDALVLDRLVGSDDEALKAWIAEGASEVEVEGVGALSEGDEVVKRLLTTVGERLRKGEVWGVGKGLGETLLRMAEAS